MKVKVKIIRDTLEGSKTKSKFGLDGHKGNMEKMCGEIFIVEGTPSEITKRDRISLWSKLAGRTFTFSTADIKVLSSAPPKLPKPEKFNPKLLDI